ncbi:hypothetical protein HPP92_002299 [Vanilla planifolia]|uniref:Uncharacterized protein n=1 Tax=Vanilla planifolia TaxID=51239 RepID=A0A835SDI8_VANPL|nr:hypothetical protein HPP92_002299 [Vanilla planifolia]
MVFPLPSRKRKAQIKGRPDRLHGAQITATAGMRFRSRLISISKQTSLHKGPLVSTYARSDQTRISASKAQPTHHLVGLIATPKPAKATFSYHNVVTKDGVIGSLQPRKLHQIARAFYEAAELSPLSFIEQADDVKLHVADNWQEEFEGEELEEELEELEEKLEEDEFEKLEEELEELDELKEELEEEDGEGGGGGKGKKEEEELEEEGRGGEGGIRGGIEGEIEREIGGEGAIRGGMETGIGVGGGIGGVGRRGIGGEIRGGFGGGIRGGAKYLLQK